MRSIRILSLLPVFFLVQGSLASRETPLTFEVIVNASNPATELTLAKLREILLGNLRQWPNHRRITIVQREAQNATVASVLKAVLGMSSRDYTRYLLQLEFKGSEPVQLKTLLSDEGACEFVRNAPGAVAFFSGSTLSSIQCGREVRVIPISDSGVHLAKAAIP